jgi:hypothetical protein
MFLHNCNKKIVGGDEIKFHDPNEFAQQGQVHGQKSIVTRHGGGAPPENRVSHKHSLGGSSSDHGKE